MGPLPWTLLMLKQLFTIFSQKSTEYSRKNKSQRAPETLTDQEAVRPSTFNPRNQIARKRKLAVTFSAVLKFWEGILPVSHRNYASSQSEPKTMKKRVMYPFMMSLSSKMSDRLMMG